MVNCSKDDFTFGSLQAPSNLQVAVELIKQQQIKW
jgi:hypothetical protein